MKRRAFIQSVGLATFFTLTTRKTAVAATERPGSASHKILSCNVRVDVPADSKQGDGWATRKDFCADVIEAQKADLIGLQEAQIVHTDYLRKRMPQYDMHALSNSTTEFHPINAIFFKRDRYTLISSGGFWFSETPHIQASRGWDTANPRFINWVDLHDRRAGKKFRFWNTHFDHKGQQAREHAAKLVVEASRIFAPNFPQILTGDMNANMNNPAIKTLKAGEWIDTYGAVHGPKDPGFTAHAFKGEKNPATNTDGSPKLRIDWIFTRGPVKATSAAVLRHSRNGRYPSDHYFMSAEVVI